MNSIQLNFFSFEFLQIEQPPSPFEEEKGDSRSTNSTADNTPTEPKVNMSQKFLKHFQTPFDRINSFINALAESRLSVSSFTFHYYFFNNLVFFYT